MQRQRTLSFRAKNLLILAGPPSSGKSTLLSRIEEGSSPKLREQLGFGDPRTWTLVAATDLYEPHPPVIERLVVHYDLLAQRTHGGFRNIPELIERADNLVILTLWTDSGSLRQRTWARIVKAVSTFPINPNGARQRIFRIRRLWRRYRVFRSRKQVFQLYRDWFELSARYPQAPHWIVDSSTVASTASAQALESARGGLLAPLKLETVIEAKGA